MKLSTRAKIVSGFASIFIISITIGIYGLYSINTISMMSATQTEFNTASANVSDVLAAHYAWRQNLTIAAFTNTEFSGSYDPDGCALGKWRNSDDVKKTADNEILSLLDKIDEPHRLIHNEAKVVMDMMENGDIEESQSRFTDTILPNADTAISLLTEMSEHYDTMTDNLITRIQDFQRQALSIIIILIIVATVLSLFLSIVITKSVLKPLRTLADSANMVANGSFSVNLNYSVNDEVGRLTHAFASLVDTFKSLIGDMHRMSENHAAGDTDYLMDNDRYSGEFKDVVSGINFMINEYVGLIHTILDVVRQYADGDFSARLEPLPGKKALANSVLDTVAVNLNSVESSVMLLVNATLDGNLDRRVDDSQFNGGWKSIIVGMNKMLEASDTPLVEAQKVLALVSEGRLDVKIEGKYKGQFEKMSLSINRTIEILSSYISEISSVLNQLASDNFNIVINREYIGKFSEIKVSLNAIIDRLNNVMEEIGTAAEQVSAGAKQVSESSMALSQGATEQAGSVEELNATIEEIRANTSKNAEDSSTANDISTVAKDNALLGNDEMKALLNSMSEINAASQNISKIIKVISDIAFQTNLLALNASVEAARAGVHGKGFAVVAEEVGTLALRSQNAVKETTELIDRSIEKVNEGTRIANNTAQALTRIVEGVESVSDIIGKIALSSKEQAVAIAQITDGIGQISQVTQANSATSEESAAASEELSSQSEMLKSMTSIFELRRLARH